MDRKCLYRHFLRDEHLLQVNFFQNEISSDSFKNFKSKVCLLFLIPWKIENLKYEFSFYCFWYVLRGSEHISHGVSLYKKKASRLQFSRLQANRESWPLMKGFNLICLAPFPARIQFYHKYVVEFFLFSPRKILQILYWNKWNKIYRF